MLRLIDKTINFLAMLAGIYLVVIMVGIVFQATARSLGYSGSSHIFTFTEFGLLYIAMAASPWLVRSRGHVYIELLTAAVPDVIRPALSRIVTLLCVVVCLFMVWYGI
ncbi:MAG: TRAP transporter small permease subunit, partial [Burkholderiaceae bacterium]